MKRLFLPFVSLLVVGLTACGDSETKGNESPTNQTPTDTAAKPAETAAQPAASATANTSAVGTWSLDGTASFEANRSTIEGSMADAPEEQRAMVLGMLTEHFAAMKVTLTLGDDRTVQGSTSMPNPFTGETEESTLTGTWSADGAAITLVTREDGSDADETKTGNLEGAQLIFVQEENGQPMRMIFTRQG